jgi:hypothetical protein
MVEEIQDNNIHFYGKVAKMPKNSKAAQSYTFLEKIKISKQKLWYILVENQNQDSDEIKMIKYNNKKGFNLKIFVDNLKNYYEHNEQLKPFIEKLEIDGNDKFSIIRNIENVEIDGKKLISIIMEDLIKLLK